jgi:hypothetical protein
MPIDLDAIKNRLQTLQQTTSRTSNLWKPSPGTQQIRMLPYKHNKDNPFIELYFHYDIGSKSYLSPVSFGRPDPFVEFADKLKSTGNRDDYMLAKKLEPKMRTFVPVAVRGEEDQPVRFWGFGKMVYQELLGFISDPDYGDLTDPITGRDIVVEFQSAEELGRSFPKTTIRVKPNQTRITDDKTKYDAMINDQKKITDIYTELSYEELTDVLNTWLNPDDVDEPETVTTNTSESASKPAGNAKKVEDVSEAFDQLFNS